MKRKIFYVLEILIVMVGFIMMEVSFASGEYKVVDGDSLEKGDVRIRLNDIDAPELYQNCYDKNEREYECGKVAKNYLQKMSSKIVDCVFLGKDKYERSLMECYLENGRSINSEMVLHGWAVSYGEKYKDEELRAKNDAAGIWQGRFMRPELFRALQRSRENLNKNKKM